MNKLKKYVIATPENPEHFTTAAYLLEIKRYPLSELFEK